MGAAPLGDRVESRDGCPPVGTRLAADGKVDGDRPSDAQLEHEGRFALVDVLGRRREGQAGSTDDAVEARVAQHDATAADERLQPPPVGLAPHAAHLEQIGEVRLEPD